MVGSLYQPPPPSLPVAATAATLLLAVAAALAAVATLLLAVVVALAVATAAATEKSIDALRQSDRAVLRGLPIRLEEAHSHSDGAVHGAPSAGHSGSRHSDPSSQEQPSGKSFDGRGGKFIPTPTTLSRRGRTVRPPHLSGGGAQRGVAELLHHVAGREALVTPDFQSVEVEKLDSEGGDCGAEGRHFAPGGGEALCRNGARKKETKKTLAKVATKKKKKKRSPRSQQKESKVALVQGAYGLRGSYGLHGSYGRRRCGEHGKTGKAVAGERTTLNAHWCLGCSGVAGSGDLPWVESAGATQCDILKNALEWVNAQGVIA